MELQINPKFKELLPALSEEEFNQLEASILADGVRESIKVWRNQIVDGHNRFEICTNYDLPYPILDLHFKDEGEALEWILRNQLSRRNLKDADAVIYWGELYNLEKKKIGAQPTNSNAVKNESAIIAELNLTESSEVENESEASEQEIVYDEGAKPAKQTLTPPSQTAQKIAKESGKSARTIENYGKIAEALKESPELKEPFRNKEISQKAVIEHSKEIAEPKPEPETSAQSDGKDDFTKLAARHAKVFLDIFAQYEEAVKNAYQDFKKQGVELESFGDKLAAFNREHSPQTLLLLRTEARLLKTLVKCPKCKGEKCSWCKETGYMAKHETTGI